MATTNFDLQSVDVGGTLHEDVMDELFNIDPVDLEFTNRAGTGTLNNSSYSWVEEELNDVDTTRKRVDGSASTGNDHKTGLRVWNEAEEQTRICEISDRAQNTDSIGVDGLMADSMMKRQKELRRNVEATVLSNQASVPDDGNTVEGQTASVQAFIVDHYYPGAGGAAGGFQVGTRLVNAATPGTRRAMTETLLIQAEEETYTDGGDPNIIMSGVSPIGKIAKYFFKDDAQIATIRSNSKNGADSVTATAAVNFYRGQYLNFELVANRSQQPYTDAGGDDAYAVYGLDMPYWDISYVQGYQAKDLARTGLSDRKEVSVDFGLKALQQKASFCIADVSGADAMTQ